MKKLFFMLMFLLMIPVLLVAQELEPPTNWGDVIMNPQQWFVSFGAVAVLTTFIAAFLNGLLKVTKSFIKQLVAWGVAIILLVGSSLINFGYAAEFPILLVIVHGFGAGLVANGIFDVPVINSVLKVVEGWFKKE